MAGSPESHAPARWPRSPAARARRGQPDVPTAPAGRGAGRRPRESPASSRRSSLRARCRLQQLPVASLPRAGARGGDGVEIKLSGESGASGTERSHAAEILCGDLPQASCEGLCDRERQRQPKHLCHSVLYPRVKKNIRIKKE